MISKSLLLSAILTLAVARTDLSGCVSSATYDQWHEASLIWYVPGTGEVCDFPDCGGGRAPPKYDDPACPGYTGTATYSPSYLAGYGAAATAAAPSTTAPSVYASATDDGSGGFPALTGETTLIITASASAEISLSETSTSLSGSTSRSGSDSPSTSVSTPVVSSRSAVQTASSTLSSSISSSSTSSSSAAAAANASSTTIVDPNGANTLARYDAAGMMVFVAAILGVALL